METWKPIPGYEGHYEASDQGHIRSIDRWVTRKDGRRHWHKGRILSPKIDKQRHYVVNLKVGGKQAHRYVHRLVAMAHIGPPDGPRAVARHLDDDPSNNRLENIAWGSESDNKMDSVRNGTHYHATRTHCPRGHPYSGDNLYILPGSGGRVCRTCQRASYRRYVERKRARKVV